MWNYLLKRWTTRVAWTAPPYSIIWRLGLKNQYETLALYTISHLRAEYGDYKTIIGQLPVNQQSTELWSSHFCVQKKLHMVPAKNTWIKRTILFVFKSWRGQNPKRWRVMKREQMKKFSKFWETVFEPCKIIKLFIRVLYFIHNLEPNCGKVIKVDKCMKIVYRCSKWSRMWVYVFQVLWVFVHWYTSDILKILIFSITRSEWDLIINMVSWLLIFEHWLL